MSDISDKWDNINDTSDASNLRTCPLNFDDCRDRQFKEHYILEKHQENVVRCAQQLRESKNGNLSEADSDTEEGKTSIDEAYSKLSITTKSLEANHEEFVRLEDELTSFKDRIEILSEQLNDIQREMSLETAQLDATTINQNILTEDVITLKQEVEDENQIIKQALDGTMVWKITNVNEKVCDAQSERQTSIYSPPFYTSNSGYRLCVRLYLNGDGTARGSHISIFLVILRGSYDSILKWPFSYRVSFCLCDQRTMIEKNGAVKPKHIIQSFQPDIKSISFERPRSAMNIASGVPKFFSLDEFNKPPNENLYVIHDTMYIKTFIDFIGLERSILPIIFNVNIALPVHIQQKLISDEIKRHSEQNINSNESSNLRMNPIRYDNDTKNCTG